MIYFIANGVLLAASYKKRRTVFAPCAACLAATLFGLN